MPRSGPALAADGNGTSVTWLLQLVWDEQERRGERIAVVQASSAEIFGAATTAPKDEITCHHDEDRPFGMAHPGMFGKGRRRSVDSERHVSTVALVVQGS